MGITRTVMFFPLQLDGTRVQGRSVPGTKMVTVKFVPTVISSTQTALNPFDPFWVLAKELTG